MENTATYYFTPLKMEGDVSPLIAFPADVNENAEGMKSFYRTVFAVVPEQTHSMNVGIVKHRWERFENTDALITFEEDLPIGVVTADCVPIVVYAPDVRGIAAIHAGWKGTLDGIVDNVIDEFERHGARTENILVCFGPSISAERYEVDPELARRFIDEGFEENVLWPEGEKSRPHLDLQGINITRMVRRGVGKDNITPSKKCTFTAEGALGKPLLPSYRRDGERASRMLTSIMLLNEKNYYKNSYKIR